ncbi:MAG: biotin synthase BioB [Alphaproteobacteria bacterium]|nr:biotin synthase BioB [Alphaproteobacteria bacterium]
MQPFSHETPTAAVDASPLIKHDWQLSEVLDLFALPFNDLLFKSHSIHRQTFDPNSIQTSTLLSIKTGACPEDCKYCPQSAHYKTQLEKEPLMDAGRVKEMAMQAKNAGATRFCMGAAWSRLHDRDLPQVVEMIKHVKDQGLETCMTLGMLSQDQAHQLKEAGLDFYNHNIDTSEEFYKEIISTRTYQDRLDTLEYVRQSGMKTCCGGIIGMGEGLDDRANMLITLANMPEHPHSVPINLLVKVEGTPLSKQGEVDIFDFIRTIAIARILMPYSFVRLSAGRTAMASEAQALCFFAGANSIFYGEKLLTTANPEADNDNDLFKRLGLTKMSHC